MRDKEAARFIILLEGLVGASGPLYLMREMKQLQLSPPMSALFPEEKELLLNNISEHVLSHCYSQRKISMIKSKMYKVLGISPSSHAMTNDTEGGQWLP